MVGDSSRRGSVGAAHRAELKQTELMVMLQNTDKEVHKYEFNLPGNAGAQFIATHIVLFVLATLPF